MNSRIFLAPKVSPGPRDAWVDMRPREVEVFTEDEHSWVGRPIDNPNCPTLTYPKTVWRLAR